MPDQFQEPAKARDARVDEIIAAYLKAVRSGQAPDREALLLRHPELAEELAEFFADEALFDSVAGPLRAIASPDEPRVIPSAEVSTGRADDATRTFADSKVALLDDYRLLGEIARGGMGVVYRAQQLSLNRPVAVKMIVAGRLASASEVRRFHIEAEAAAHLDHPNIVPIYEVGEHEGRPFFSMRLVEGGDLTQHLERFRQDPAAACRLMATVARAVHHAHQRGILHRDLKPRNILIDADGQPQITDFGLAKRMEETSDLTQSGTVLGTACYMAPEQARADKAVTVAVDVYSLGAILYELLTGRPPFRGATPAGTILQLLDSHPESPRELNPKVDRDLETICMKCLEKEPQRRYGSAEVVADDLDRWLGGKPISARPISGIGRVWRWCARNPAFATVAAGALAIIFLLSGFFYWRLVNENRATRSALANQAAASQLAREEAARARAAEDRAQDALARSRYEQARALLASGELDRRWQVFQLLAEAERLRARPRQSGPSPGNASSAEHGAGLPSRADLRTQAVAAALLPGIRAVGQVKVGRVAQPGLSPGGTLAASLWTDDKSQNAGVLLADVATGRERGLWQNEGIAGTAFALNQDGSLLASAGFGDGRIALWNLREGKRIAILDWPRIPGLGDKPIAPVFLVSSDMAFGPESRYFVAVCRSAVPEGVDSETLAEVLVEPDSGPRPVTSPLLFGEMIQTVLLWDVEGSTKPRTLATTIHDTQSRSVVFASKGKWLVFPLSAETVRVYDLRADRVLTDIKLPVPLAGKPAIDGSGRRLICPCSGSAAGQGTVLVWDLVSNVEESQLKTDFSLASCVPAFSPDGNQLALGTKSGRVVLFDLLRQREVIRLKAAPTGMVGLLRWDPDGRHLNAWDMQAGFKRWELGNRPLSSIRTGQNAFSFSLSPDGQWLACGGGPDGKIQLIDRTTGSTVRTFPGYRFPLPGALVFSPKGQTLAQIGAYQIVMWNITTGRETGRLEETTGLPGRIESVAFAEDETALVSVISTKGPRVSVWDVKGRREIWRSSDKNVRWACLSPDGRRLFGFTAKGSTGNCRMTVCEISDDRTIAQAEVPGVPFGSQSFSPDGELLVSLDSPQSGPNAAFAAFAADTTQQAESGLVLLSLPGGGEELRIVGPTRPTACAFSPNSRVIAVGYQDGSAKLLDLAQGDEIFRADFCSSPISQLAFTPDGASLAVTDGRSIIQLLHLTTLRQQLAKINLSW